MRRIWLHGAALAVLAAGCGSGGGGGVVAGISVDCPSVASAAQAADTSATLSWDVGSDPRIAGYRVYYGTGSRDYAQAKGAGLNAGSCSTYVVTGLDRGLTYYFAVTAYDASGNESDFSNEARKTIP
jgi:fibronectin type 3 domain-containing protein